MTPRLTILHKGLILIAVPLFFQIAFIAFVAKIRKDSFRAEGWTIHTKDVIAQAQRCRVLLLSAHGAIQGFILTHNPVFEANLRSFVARIPGEIQILKDLVSDNPSQVEAASRLRGQSEVFLARMTESAGLVREGRMDAVTADSRRRVSQGFLEAIEHDFDEFLSVEKTLDIQRHDQLADAWFTFDRILEGGILISVLFTVLLAVVFSRNISGRISNLTDNAIRITEGKELTPQIKGSDEIAQLDHVFHDMARTLAEATGRERLHADLLERRAAELASVNEQLRQKAQENEMFVYSVSHDLRSPLVNLQGFSKELGMIGKDLDRLVSRDDVPPEVRGQARLLIGGEMKESIGFIQTAVIRLSAIIDALLRLSRAGRVEYRQQPVDVSAVVARVVSALRGTIDDRGAQVAVGILPAASGDPTAIEQVFANLIGNALNYLDRDRPGRIEVFAVGADEGAALDLVIFAVRDNGLGIPDAYKEKIFTAFQRFHGDVAKGEGIGLALVRRVVDRHGGKVWFESEHGRGTTFFVALPAMEVPTDRDDDQSSLVTSEIKSGSDA